MRSQRKRHLFLGLGLTVALGLVVALPATASAVSSLHGESLNGSSSSGNTSVCPPFGASTFSVSGTATGPYPGTFTETGTFGRDSHFNIFVSATFTITSGTTTITGSKTGPAELGQTGCGTDGSTSAISQNEPYTATIHTPSGNFHDEGGTNVDVNVTGTGTATLTELFGSLTQPVLIEPTNKDQCKNNGWKNFPQFRNQGQCVSFVERQSQT